MYIYNIIYLLFFYLSNIYFPMLCQKLCQNNVSGWGSLEDNSVDTYIYIYMYIYIQPFFKKWVVIMIDSYVHLYIYIYIYMFLGFEYDLILSYKWAYTSDVSTHIIYYIYMFGY
jgi:hypothetical protein